MKKEDRVLNRVREPCLSLPETSEAGSWGHPNFRVGKRTFVTFEWIKGKPSIAFRLDPKEVGFLLRRKGFFATPYGQGKWVSVWGDRWINWSLVKRLVKRSYRLVRDQNIMKIRGMKRSHDRSYTKATKETKKGRSRA